MLLAANFFILIGFGGKGKPSSGSVMWRSISIFPLWNIPQTSALDADATMCFRILHSVWIGTFVDGGRFGDFYGSVRSDLR